MGELGPVQIFDFSKNGESAHHAIKIGTRRVQAVDVPLVLITPNHCDTQNSVPDWMVELRQQT
jgi:hypothetical protein